jgi:hypothetical protein
MSNAPNTILTEILTNLNQVGGLLYAIDRQEGDTITHWQQISQLDHRLRRLAKQLDEDTLSQLPSLAVFSLSSNQILSCWGICAEEIETLLGDNASRI